jgi:hypothetical protein
MGVAAGHTLYAHAVAFVFLDLSSCPPLIKDFGSNTTCSLQPTWKVKWSFNLNVQGYTYE